MKRFVERILGRSEPAPESPGSERGSVTEPWLPDGRRLYCIGDIHGRLDLLEELHAMIVEDAAGYSGSKALIYLGDIVDRGAQSKQVLDLLLSGPLDGFEQIFLMGNHERSMLDFLEYPEEAAAWLSFGGRETLLSYGVGLGRIQWERQAALLRDELDAKLPAAHRDLLQSCHLMHTEGHYCFVHAGIRPGVALEEQVVEDLLWIRDEFTHSASDHGCIVVHGHSITGEVDWQSNRIGIDTGAYASGLLTALVLEGGEQRLLQTGRPAGAAA